MDSGAVGTPTASGEPVFLDSLTPAESAALESRGIRRTYLRGHALFHEHGTPDRVHVLLSGFVKLSRLSDDGREVILAIRGPGDLLGEQSAIDGRPRSATATALDPVTAIVLSGDDFFRLLERESHVALVVLKMLSNRLRQADVKQMELSLQDTTARVAARILELSERFGADAGAGVEIHLPISQEELAGWTGCSRDSVVKALQAMRSLGWIETGRRRITVRELEELRRRAA
jgi:CRP/FNR family transcriptional regulator, cyclic AMP receptor protein